MNADPAPQDEPSSAQSRIPPGLWAVVALVAWSLGVIALLDRTPYGFDEATARAVLVLWSIADEIPSPVVTLGVPDFRALFLAPAGVLFSGSLVAVKLCTLFVLLAAAIGLYRWRARDGDTEAPLLATGLLLLAPAAVASIDRIAIGPFLLLSFVLGAWADELYRATRMRFGGWYFAQLLLCMMAATLHPAGLAYPLVLAVSWLRQAPPEPPMAGIIPGRERTHVLAGVGIATLIGVLLAAGWPQQSWFGNPILALSQTILGWHAESTVGDALALLLGLLLLLALFATLWAARRAIGADRLASTVTLAAGIALFAGDTSFALLVLVLLLFWGFPVLLRVRVGQARGFAGQRGVAFALLMVLSTAFLLADRARYEGLKHEPELSAQDRLIQFVAASVQAEHPVGVSPGLVTGEEKARSGPRVASQWPGRTMIACRCSALPLPPATQDPAAFAANLRGITFVVFDPQNPANRGLSQNFALLGGAGAETLALQAGGVVLKIHAPAGPDANAPGGPAAAPGGSGAVPG
jgi:hypothetical protein